MTLDEIADYNEDQEIEKALKTLQEGLIKKGRVYLQFFGIPDGFQFDGTLESGHIRSTHRSYFEKCAMMYAIGFQRGMRLVVDDVVHNGLDGIKEEYSKLLVDLEKREFEIEESWEKIQNDNH